MMTTEQVWRDLGSRLRSYFRRRAPDDATADDLLQETFLRIYRRAVTFRPEGNASSWIFTVAVNLARDHLRNRKQKILYLDQVDGGPDDGRRSQPTPPEVLEREEKRRQVRKVLAELPELARTMLVLRDFEGLSYQELGEILRCEVGTVKSRIHRARKQFEELFRTYH